MVEVEYTVEEAFKFIVSSGIVGQPFGLKEAVRTDMASEPDLGGRKKGASSVNDSQKGGGYGDALL